jgi:hypothetical protein
MPLLVNCKSCDWLFDECGGSMSRGRHYSPYCSRYCQLFDIKGHTQEEWPSPKFDLNCDWCGDPFQLMKGRGEGSQRMCSLKCSRESRWKRNNKAHRVLQIMKILAHPLSASDIAYEISKIPCNGWRNSLGSRSVANVMKLLYARGAIEIIEGHTNTYKLKDPHVPFKQYGKPA